MSTRVRRDSDYMFTYPITGGTLDSSISHFVVNVSIAGQSHTSGTLTNAANLNYTFTWDGNDNSSNPINTAAVATVEKHTYWVSPVADIPEKHTLILGGFQAKALGLGGLTISGVHFYDYVAQVFHDGNGLYKDAPLTKVTVDGSGNVAITSSPTFDYYMVVDREGYEAYLFDATGRHRQTRSTRSGALLKTITYDGSGRLSSMTDSFSQAISFSYSGSTVTITAPHSQVTTLTLSSGWISSIANPMSQSHSFSLGSDGLMSTYSPPNGGTSTFTYDAKGLLATDTHSSGASLSFSKTMTPNGAGTSVGTITMTTNLGLVTSYSLSYSAGGNTYRAETLPSGDLQKYEYSPAYTYDTTHGFGARDYNSVNSDPRFGNTGPHLRNWTSYKGSSSAGGTNYVSDTFSSSSVLKLTSETQSNYLSGAYNWQKNFTLSTGVEAFISPLGRTTNVTYNSANQVTQITPPLGSAITFGYDGSGRLNSVTQSSRTTAYSYDGDGNLYTVTDPLSQVTTFGYDGAGRRTSTTLPDSRVINYAYDNNGNMSSVQTPASITHSLTYSLYNLIASYVAPTLSSTTYTTSYTYDNDKRLTQITRPDSSTLSFTYASTYGTLATMIAPEGTYTYTYSSGKLSSVVSPASVTNSFGFDGPNITTAQTSWSSYSPKITHAYSGLLESSLTYTPTSGSPTAVSFTYNNDRLMTAAGDLSLTRTSSTGLISQATLTSVTEDYSYDSTYAEVSQYDAKYSGTSFFKQAYSRDLLGRISRVAETIGGTTTNYDYVYDSAGRLSTVTIGGTLARTYNYTNNSNRSSLVTSGGTTSATYDDQDRILTYGTLTFTHNMRGERTAMSNSSNSNSFAYSFNGLGSLSQMTHTYPSGGGTATDTYDYKNDALGRRIEVSKNSTVQNRYLYDERGRIVAELNSSGNFVSIFVYATMGHLPDYMLNGGNKYKFVHDQLGSVRRVVNASSGSVSSSIDYDEFGKVIASSSLSFQPFGFAGGLRDDVSGFVRFGARDYDPETGRWLSKDPILFGGGAPNLYSYVLNDPINLIDPSGLYDGSMDPTGGGENTMPIPGGGGLCGVPGAGAALPIAIPILIGDGSRRDDRNVCGKALLATLAGCNRIADPSAAEACRVAAAEAYRKCINAGR